MNKLKAPHMKRRLKFIKQCRKNSLIRPLISSCRHLPHKQSICSWRAAHFMPEWFAIFYQTVRYTWRDPKSQGFGTIKRKRSSTDGQNQIHNPPGAESWGAKKRDKKIAPPTMSILSRNKARRKNSIKQCLNSSIFSKTKLSDEYRAKKERTWRNSRRTTQNASPMEGSTKSQKQYKL